MSSTSRVSRDACCDDGRERLAVLPFVAARAAQRDIGGGPHDRHRRPQLVRRVGHEPALGRKRAAQAVQHDVEGARRAVRARRRRAARSGALSSVVAVIACASAAIAVSGRSPCRPSHSRRRPRTASASGIADQAGAQQRPPLLGHLVERRADGHEIAGPSADLLAHGRRAMAGRPPRRASRRRAVNPRPRGPCGSGSGSTLVHAARRTASSTWTTSSAGRTTAVILDRGETEIVQLAELLFDDVGRGRADRLRGLRRTARAAAASAATAPRR